MLPAACALLCALLLGVGPRAAGAHGQNLGAAEAAGLRPGSPARSHPAPGRSTFPPESRTQPRAQDAEEDEDDLAAEADRLAGPAAADLLASSSVTGRSRSGSEEGDGTLEEGVVIDASKPATAVSAADGTSTAVPSSSSSSSSTGSSTGSTGSTSSSSGSGGSVPTRVPANVQEPDIRVTTTLQQPASNSPATSKGGEQDSEATTLESTLSKWTTAGSTPTGWPSRSTVSLTSPEDLQLQLLPWGPWHCHCRSGTMSRTRSGRLHGLSGRLRVGALSQLRTEHRPCTYDQCSCDRELEECPLDTSTCSGPGCSSPRIVTHKTKTTTTTTRHRPMPEPLIHNSALDFWKRVRIGLEDIWNSLSSMFTEMQPIEKNQR